MDMADLIYEIRAKVHSDPSLSGQLINAIANAYWEVLPMVGTLPKVKVWLKLSETAVPYQVEMCLGLGTILAGGNVRCVTPDGAIYDVDHAGAHRTPFRIGDGSFFWEKPQ